MASVPCNQPGGPPTTTPLFGDLGLMSLKCSGLFAAIKRGKKKVYKYQVIGNYFATKQLDIVGLQEPHNMSEHEESKLVKVLHRLGHHVCTNTNPDGRGGTAFVWRHQWVMERAPSISPNF